MSDVEVRSCEECGASIYPEHIGSNKAGFWSGKLYCVHCYATHRKQQVTLDPDEFGGSQVTHHPIDALTDAEVQPTMPSEEPPVDAAPELDLSEPTPAGAEISLEEFAKPTIKPLSTPRSITGDTDYRYKRHLHHVGSGALRCRIFHAKLNDGALRFMEDQVNQWIDTNPEIEIKHVNTNVGVVEGKSSEPHLILTLFF